MHIKWYRLIIVTILRAIKAIIAMILKKGVIKDMLCIPQLDVE